MLLHQNQAEACSCTWEDLFSHDLDELIRISPLMVAYWNVKNSVAAAYHIRFLKLPKKSTMINSHTSRYAERGKRRDVLF